MYNRFVKKLVSGKLIACISGSAFGAATLFAQSTSSSPGIAIVGASVFDATGVAPSVKDVLISKGRITAVGAHLQVPTGYQVIDAAGEALLPGFYDLHTHWTGGGASNDTPMIANADLAAGVTTSNDFNASPESFQARRAWLATLNAPHVNLCGRLSSPGGHGADWSDITTTKWVSTPASARAGVEAIVPYKPDCLGEVMTDGWRYGMSPDMTDMNAETIAALVDEAHTNKLPVLTHTLRIAKGAEAGKAKVDVIAHALQDRDIDDVTIAAIKQGGSTYAPTLAVYEPNKGHRSSAPVPAQTLTKWNFALHNTLRLYNAGVPITLGTDAGMPGTPHGKATLREMELLVQAGLPPTAALMAGTSNSARAMGQLSDRGTIEAGKRADLVLIKGTPWSDIADVEKTDRVFVDGKLAYGPGAPLPNPDLPMPSVKIASLVDDFEHSDGRSNLDTLAMTNPDRGMDRSTEIIQIIPRSDKNKALLMSARLGSKDNAMASVVLPLTRGSISPADLRSFHGVQFDLRGDGAYQVSLNSLNGPWVTETDGASSWKTVSLPFTAFHHVKGAEGPKADAPWSGNDLVELEIIDHRSAGATTWLEIDNIKFY
jgi:imidazolonepropionase-like amidohydrolase